MSAAFAAMNGTRAAKVDYAKSGFDVPGIALEQQSTISCEAVPC